MTQNQPDQQSNQPSQSPRERIKNQTLSHLHDIWLNDVASQMAINRAAAAMGNGINPEPYARPFPGNTTHITVQQPRRAAPWPWILAGVLGLGGVSGIVATVSYLGKSYVQPATPPVAPSPANPDTDTDTQYEWQAG